MRTRPPKKASGKGTTTPTKTTTDVPTPTKVSKGERKRGGRGKGRKPAKLPFAKVTQEETVDVSNLATPAASTTRRGQQVPLTATASMPVPSPPTVLDKMEEILKEKMKNKKRPQIVLLKRTRNLLHYPSLKNNKMQPQIVLLKRTRNLQL